MAIQPRDILPPGRMVEIVRIDGEAPGPVPRTVPPELKPWMLARVTKAHQIGTNGSAVMMYEVRVGSEPVDRGDPEPIRAQLYADDLNPLPLLSSGTAAPALADARRRFENSNDRSITDVELAKVREETRARLKSLVTPDMVAKVKADAERLKVEAEAKRQAAIAKCRAEAAAAMKPETPRFAEGTQNDRLPADMVKALAETGPK